MKSGFRWRKFGRIFDPAEYLGRPWMSGFAQAPATLIMDNCVRVYFSCRPPADPFGRYVSYSAFVDLDRNDLCKVLRVASKPIMPMGELGTFDEFGTYPVSVVRAENELLAYYGGWTRCESVPFNVAIGVAKSSDAGETFERLGSGPVLGYAIDEPFVVSGPKVRRFGDKWYLWYIAGSKWKISQGRPEPVYKIRMAVSSDGLQWSRIGRNLISDRIDSDEAQASPDVFCSGGRYHMFFCYRHSENYRGKAGGYRIGYADSQDLVNWSRDDSKAAIDVSADGWDSEMVAYPHVFAVDDRVFLLYNGNGVGRDGFGLAELEGTLA